MLAFLYAFLIGGLVAAVGGGSSDSAPAAAGGSPDPGPAPTPPAPMPPVAEDSPPENEDAPPPADDGGADIPEPPALPSDAYDIGWGGLTAEEQLIVELVNRARLDPMAEVARLNEGLASGISSSSRSGARPICRCPPALPGKSSSSRSSGPRCTR